MGASSWLQGGVLKTTLQSWLHPGEPRPGSPLGISQKPWGVLEKSVIKWTRLLPGKNCRAKLIPQVSLLEYHKNKMTNMKTICQQELIRALNWISFPKKWH